MKKKWCWLLIALFLLFISYSSFLRIRAERKSRRVEVCISWDDAKKIVGEDGLTNPEENALRLRFFLERCKIMGVSSIVLKEETLGDLFDSSKVVFFTKQEIEKLRAIGLVSGEFLKPNFLLVKKDSALADRIRKSMDQKPIGFKKVGEDILIENPDRLWEEEIYRKVGFDPDQLEMLKTIGFHYVYLFEEEQKNPFWGEVRVDFNSPLVQSGWLIQTNSQSSSVFDVSLKNKIVETILKSNSNFILFENQPESAREVIEIASKMLEKAIRSHTILPEEMRNMSPEKIKSRWIRAVKERSCRFLYYRLNRDWNAEENLTFLRECLQELKSEGFILQKVSLSARSLTGEAGSEDIVFVTKPYKKLRLFLALLSAVAAPLIAVWFLKRKCEQVLFSIKGMIQIWAGAVLIAILTGLLINTLLPDTVFVNGLEVFRGVKIALFLPLMIVPFLLYRREQIGQFVRRKISIVDLGVVFFIFFMVYKMLERSGNVGAVPHSFELDIRFWLQNLLDVRPRFKEFLVGHPLMILGLSLYKKNSILAKVFIWCGIIGLISIVNSFCHLHTPLWISLFRTFNGFWMGGIFGAILVCLCFVLQKKLFLTFTSSRWGDGDFK